MTLADAFPDITRRREPLAPYTHLRIGGPADALVQPRTADELKAVLAHCHRERVPVRMLGGGHNLLVRDDPVPGAVVRLAGPAFSWVQTPGPGTLRAAGGGSLFELIAAAVTAGLSGLETLVGLRGTVGGSVRCNVGDKSGEIAAAVTRVAVLTEAGAEQVRRRDELQFGDHSSDLDEPVILWVEFALEADSPDAILKRLRRAWVQRKAAEPPSVQNAVRLFRDPPGWSAAALIDQAGLAGAKAGGAELSTRNPNYAVAHPGTTARDILRLIDQAREAVAARSGIALDRELHVW
jgi:UDP-N-acetylmuramate dehydrogenase